MRLYERVIDRTIFTIQDEYKVICALASYRLVPLSMTLSDFLNPTFKVTVYSLKANISQTVHPIYSMFGSSLLG